MVLIAPAPDFTEALMRPALPPEAVRELELNGSWTVASDYGPPYALTRRFLDEGRDWTILDRAIEIDVPVRILQGGRDPDVPWAHALKLAERLKSDDVVFTLIKDGDHRLSRPQDLDAADRDGGGGRPITAELAQTRSSPRKCYGIHLFLPL